MNFKLVKSLTLIFLLTSLSPLQASEYSLEQTEKVYSQKQAFRNHSVAGTGGVVRKSPIISKVKDSPKVKDKLKVEVKRSMSVEEGTPISPPKFIKLLTPRISEENDEDRAEGSSSVKIQHLGQVPHEASEMDVQFLHGTAEHVEAYVNCIEAAENQIIIASWNLKYIPAQIFKSLMSAKKRNVYISFIVNDVKREKTLEYFKDKSTPLDEEEDELRFNLFKTKSHAKFLFVDSKSLILGSYNALGDAFEETEDTSFKIEGSINQLWPFFMSIHETYTDLGENVSSIFGSNATISKYKNPKERPLLRREFRDESRIFLLRSIKEHEEFFRNIINLKGTVSIYSPFSTRDNTLKRLSMLESLLPPETAVELKVLKKFEKGLLRLLAEVPNLRNHSQVEVVSSHQKIIIVGDHTICVGSLNWLSAAQNVQDPYRNVEFSIVLQGPKAQSIIKAYYHK